MSVHTLDNIFHDNADLSWNITLLLLATANLILLMIDKFSFLQNFIKSLISHQP